MMCTCGLGGIIKFLSPADYMRLLSRMNITPDSQDSQDSQDRSISTPAIRRSSIANLDLKTLTLTLVGRHLVLEGPTWGCTIVPVFMRDM